MTRNSMAARVLLGAALSLAASVAVAGNLVTNGDFQSNGGNGQLGYDTYATGWSIATPNYTFLFAPGTADTTGADGLLLWGPGDGVNNGLTATSPAGGYFIAADPTFQDVPIGQTVNGLTAGHSYTVSFWWAGAQDYGYYGATQQGWQVSLGSQTKDTTLVSVASQGFSGWMKQSFTFTASSSSELLSFLALGGPGGTPPAVLLNGISLTPVPEPATWGLFIAGLAALGAFAWRRRNAG